MEERISQAVWDRLRCVECGNPLEQVQAGAKCPRCGAGYPATEHGSLDLRLKQPKAYPVEFKLGNPAAHRAQLHFGAAEAAPGSGG